MKRCLVVFLFTCTCIACTTEDKKIPKDIMPVNEMKVIVWNMIEAGAYDSYLREGDTSIKKTNMAYFAEVLKLHHITKNEFFNSFSFYQKHPPLNKELFDSVNAYALRQRNNIYKQRY